MFLFHIWFHIFCLILKWIRIKHKYVVLATRTVNRPGCIPPPPSCKPPPLPQVGKSISIGVWAVFVWVDTCICILFCVLFVFVTRVHPSCKPPPLPQVATSISIGAWAVFDLGQIFASVLGVYLSHLYFACFTWHKPSLSLFKYNASPPPLPPGAVSN